MELLSPPGAYIRTSRTTNKESNVNAMTIARAALAIRAEKFLLPEQKSAEQLW